ncbi:exopolyphosphatase [Acetivibrio straminisolvens JCM 21531]|uniref:Exopolyphosphatase n=1 Tax=Acetivibrio straminisolvens JCM 21531 TaxID=1294263 RepID=W4V2F2_9FIRM|nr:exopolyphosphatase [Acetivibrio straminisolvens JCM 21531]
MSKKIGIIDLGSNSVRLVIFEIMPVVPLGLLMTLKIP